MTKYTLKHPYTSAAAVRLETLEVRRLTRGDIRRANNFAKDDFSQESFLLAAMVGLLPEDLDQMDIADSKALVDMFRDMVADKEHAAEQ